VRRLAPRPLRSVLGEATRQAIPAGTLARVQSCWAEVTGPAVAHEAQPVGERDGVVIVRCRSAVWAQELELLGESLRAELGAALGDHSAVRELRFVVGSGERAG
jgi:predicted nucleic acid-binding Zn ribbon protein